MDKPYIILTGALKNVGDYLIAYRAKKLLKKYVSKNFIEYKRWDYLDEHLDIINNSKGIIICGGPGFSENMYPETYPLVKNLDEIKVPITTFGVGWSGKPIDNPEGFHFNQNTRKLMDKIHGTSKVYSCRDNITKTILHREGYRNVIMTGCPVWYDIENLNKNFQEKKEIKKIVFTTPDNPKLFFQVVKLINILREKFPDAKIYNSFHRGIKTDQYTSWKSSLIYKMMANYGLLKNFEALDVSYDLSKIDFYEACDLHIGYRVHAHLYFLSKRLPSILLCEDGRGIGMAETLNTEIFKVNDKYVIQKLSNYLDLSINANFMNIAETSEKIDNFFPEMKNFLSIIKNWS